MQKDMVESLLIVLDDFVCKYENAEELPRNFENLQVARQQPAHSRSLLDSIFQPRGMIGSVFGWAFPPATYHKRPVVKSKPSPQKAAPPSYGVPHCAEGALAYSASASTVRGLASKEPADDPDGKDDSYWEKLASKEPADDPDCKDDSYWEKLYNEEAEAAVDPEEEYIARRILFGSDTLSGPDSMSEPEHDDASYPASLPEADSTKMPSELRFPSMDKSATTSSPLQHAAAAWESTVAGAGKTIEKDAQAFQQWLNKPFGAFQPQSPADNKQPWKLF